MKQENNSLDQKRRAVGALLGPLCAALIWLLPIEGINEEAHHLLAIMSMVDYRAGAHRRYLALRTDALRFGRCRSDGRLVMGIGN